MLSLGCLLRSECFSEFGDASEKCPCDLSQWLFLLLFIVPTKAGFAKRNRRHGLSIGYLSAVAGCSAALLSDIPAREALASVQERNEIPPWCEELEAVTWGHPLAKGHETLVQKLEFLAEYIESPAREFP